MAFEEFSQLSKRRREERAQKYKKKILLAVLCTIIFLLCTAIGVFTFLHFTDKQNKSDKNNNVSPPPPQKDHVKTSSKIIQIICEPTDYKKKCEDTLTKVVHTDVTKPKIVPRAIIKASISAAMDEVVKAMNRTHKFKFDKPQDKAAFDVCKKLFQDSTEELAQSMKQVEEEAKNNHIKINDLKTWLSAVYSYQETCIDAFDKGDLKNQIKGVLNSTKEYISNSLALVSQISSSVEKFNGKRNLLATFPEWMSHEQRKLLVKYTTNLTPDLTVAKDGSGNYTSINDCLNSLPQNRTKRYGILKMLSKHSIGVLNRL